MKIRFTSVAELELKAAMEFYEAAQSGLGAEFLAEVEATARLIQTHPLGAVSVTMISLCP